MATPTTPTKNAGYANGPADRPEEHRQTRPLSEHKKEIQPFPASRIGPEPTGPAGKPAGRFSVDDAD